MRNLWTIASVLAIANLFAIGSFVGWLGASGRLDRERFDDLKRMLAETPQEREDRLTTEVAEEEPA